MTQPDLPDICPGCVSSSYRSDHTLTKGCLYSDAAAQPLPNINNKLDYVIDSLADGDLTANEAKQQFSQLLLEGIDSDKSRYCGVCFFPCYEYGGWRCEIHGYKSVYISKSEAAEYRTELKQLGGKEL